MKLLWRDLRFWLALGLALRVAFASTLGSRQHQIDELSHESAAWTLAETGVLGHEGVAKVLPPLPDSLYAMVYAVTGRDFLYARLAQAILSALIVLVLYRMGKDLLGSQDAGLWAARIGAVYPFFIYYSGMLMTESLYTLLTAAGYWQLCLSLKERGKTWKRAAWASAALAAAALTRAEGAIIALVIWGVIGAWSAAGRFSWKSWVVGAALFMLPLLAWSARNRAVSGYWTLDNHGGIAFYTGTAYFELGEIDTKYVMEAFYRSPFWEKHKRLDDTAFDRACFDAAIRFMRENPARTFGQWVQKTINFWRLWPRTDKIYHESEHSNPSLGLRRWVLVAASLAFEPWLLALGLWGIYRRRADLGFLFPLPLLILGTFAAHLLTVSMMRYRVPLMPVFIVFAASALARRREAR